MGFRSTVENTTMQVIALHEEPKNHFKSKAIPWKEFEESVHMIWTHLKHGVLGKETVALTNSNPWNAPRNSDKNVMTGVVFR